MVGVSLEWLAFIVGIVYGYVKPGKTEKGEIIKKGATYGVILGVVLAVLNLTNILKHYWQFL